MKHTAQPVHDRIIAYRHARLGMVYRQENGDIIPIGDCVCGAFYSRKCPVDFHRVRAMTEPDDYKNRIWRNRKVDFKKILTFALDFAEKLAAETDTTVDDQVVALIKTIVESDLLSGWLEAAFSGTPPGVMTITSAEGEHHEALAAGGFDFDTVLKLLPTIRTIFDLIRSLLK